MRIRHHHNLTGLLAPALLVTAVALAVAGCSSSYHVEEADEATYGILETRHEQVFDTERAFTIDAGPSRNVRLTVEEILGPLPPAPPLPEELTESRLAERQTDLRKLDLASTLLLAWQNSRQYQSRKEELYRTALSLTLQRDAFRNFYAFSGDVNRVIDGPDRNRSVQTGADFNITRQLTTGATVALGLGLTGVKYLNGELGTQLESALSFTLQQPLWRGSDPVVVTNDLVQSERNVIYQLRSFTRFEKELSVDIASAYYQVLQQLDVVRNEWDNYRNLVAATERAEALADWGRLPLFEVDQARQDQLRAHNSYLVALEGFERELDSLKVQIGLPTDAPVMPSREDLDRLTEAGIHEVTVSRERAVEIALANRFDLRNTRGQVIDADREAYVAADALKGDVDFVGGMNVGSTPDTRAGRLLFHEGLYEFGLEIDLPLERVAERNAYRRALIDYDAAVRDYIDGVDSIKQQIRQVMRRLRRTRQSYVIQKGSVELARKRVASTQVLLEEGRATTRDLLESQQALVGAQNALSQALVAHRIARLEFLRDLELLEVDERGQIHDRTDPIDADGDTDADAAASTDL